MSAIMVACATSYQNRGHGTSIPLDRLVAKNDSPSSCVDRPVVALVWHILVPLYAQLQH